MITLDFETKSYADLKEVGSWVYSEHPTTEVICLCWAQDDGEIKEWWPGKNETDEIPVKLWHGLSAFGDEEFEAHNVAFEVGIWENIMVKRYGWPKIERNKWRDTMAVASYYSLPPSLAGLLKAVGGDSKDPEGGRLITKYSNLHLKTAKTEIPDEDFFKFVDYCKKDVELERQVSNYLGNLPERELPVFLLDQKINLRGLPLDKEGIEAATAIVKQRNGEIVKEFQELTKLNPTQREKVQAWFKKEGLELENMQAEYLEEKLKQVKAFMPKHLIKALELRLAISKASAKKLVKMLAQRGKDGTAKYQCKYHGAVTGRWTGLGIQPLNLSRGFEEVSPASLVRNISYRNPKYLDALYGNSIEAIGKASRHWIKAREGYRFIAGDFASIEAVVLSVLAGEEWKVQAFREGAKIYEMTADKIYKFPLGTVTKETHPEERQDGKTCELAFGYQGALGAWRKFDTSDRHSDEAVMDICKTWRTQHPAIKDFWWGLNGAAMEALESKEKVYYRNVGFERVDEWLSMILPNGKRIWYFDPEIRMAKPMWHQPDKKKACKDGSCDCYSQLVFTYMSQKEGQWKRVNTYGGKLAENVTQAVSREILVSAMLRAEDAGYPVILSVYDEILCEVQNGQGSITEFEEIMKTPGANEPWLDWPIGVEAWEGGRYKK